MPRAPIFEAMETEAEIAIRWRYLRDLLIAQLTRFESGALAMHSAGENVSAGAIAKLKTNILQFDALIAGSEGPDPTDPYRGKPDALPPPLDR